MDTAEVSHSKNGPISICTVLTPKSTGLKIRWRSLLDYSEHDISPRLRKLLLDYIGKFSNLRILEMTCDDSGSTTSFLV